MVPLEAEILRAEFSVSTELSGTFNGPIPDTLLKTSLRFILYLDSPNFTMASIVIESKLLNLNFSMLCCKLSQFLWEETKNYLFYRLPLLPDKISKPQF